MTFIVISTPSGEIPVTPENRHELDDVLDYWAATGEPLPPLLDAWATVTSGQVTADDHAPYPRAEGTLPFHDLTERGRQYAASLSTDLT